MLYLVVHKDAFILGSKLGGRNSTVRCDDPLQNFSPDVAKPTLVSRSTIRTVELGEFPMTTSRPQTTPSGMETLGVVAQASRKPLPGVHPPETFNGEIAINHRKEA
jgi:hypothetical protein